MISAVIVLLVLYPVTAWVGPGSERFFGSFNVFTYFTDSFPILFLSLVGAGVGGGSVSWGSVEVGRGDVGFGGGIGGPIRKNKTFFFFEIQALRARSSSATGSSAFFLMASASRPNTSCFRPRFIVPIPES